MTSGRAPREEGFSKDADKLDPPALAGRPAAVARRAAGERRRDPPARRGLSPDDGGGLQAALLRGPLRARPARHRDRGGRRTRRRSGEVYSLPASAYYLPPVQLTRDELTALAACLAVLEDRFAYSKPLRLALVSLMQGRPELLDEAAAPGLAVLPDRAGRRRRRPPQAAGGGRRPQDASSSATTRSAATRSSSGRVDPYGLQLVGDEWYLIGFCHLRQAVRTFRLSRIRSRVTHATRAPHDFTAPADFDLAAYRDRAPWRLGGTAGEARVAVDAAMAWWVEAHYGRGGGIETRDDGGSLPDDALRRPPGRSSPGCWASASTPRWRSRRSCATSSPRSSAGSTPCSPRRRPRASRAAARRRRPAPQPAKRRPTATTGASRSTASPGSRRWPPTCCGTATPAAKACSPSARVCEDLDLTPTELRADVRLLNLVNFGADGALLYAEYKGRDKLEVWCDLAGEAFDRARPALAAAGRHPAARRRARRRTAARRAGRRTGERGGEAPPRAARGAPTGRRRRPVPVADEIFDAVNAAIRRAPPADHRVLVGGHRRDLGARRSSPT